MEGSQITADDIVTVLPYLLAKAQIPRLIAQANFIEAFDYSLMVGDEMEVFKTNLNIAI